MLKPIAFSILICLLSSCSYKTIQTPNRQPGSLTGTAFYQQAFAFKWQQRDSFVIKEILAGNLPPFLKKFVPIHVQITDSASGKVIKATYYAAPDYLSVGSADDWVRVNITPMAAQKIADSFHCFLPTRKMVNDIYQAATVKLPPVPLYALRDSTPTMYHHHLIIEGQRKGRKGLLGGIKKDIVLSGKVLDANKPDRVAIYGWHQLDGKPIQSLYTGHVNWWVDYSQGIRLVYAKIKVEGKWMAYTEVLGDKILHKLLCDEGYCAFYRYPY
ncbi:MAG: hypothetical protein EOO06_20295 [Chitinophagaceae bacterium]|nr:MAG: hypothetical protein EOO06_20295 [Chitinophagaceae bacterium]